MQALRIAQALAARTSDCCYSHILSIMSSTRFLEVVPYADEQRRQYVSL